MLKKANLSQSIHRKNILNIYMERKILSMSKIVWVLIFEYEATQSFDAFQANDFQYNLPCQSC